MAAYHLYEDVDMHNFMVLQMLHAKTDRLLLMLRQLHMGAPTAAGPAAAAAAGMAAQLRGGAAAGAATDKAGGAEIADPGRDGPWGAPPEDLQRQYRPLHPAALGKAPPPPSSKPGGKPAQSGGGGKSLSGLISFFGIYFFFQWLTNRGN